MPFEFSDALREVPVVLAQKGGARAKVNATAQVEVSLPCSYNTVEGVRRDKKKTGGGRIRGPTQQAGPYEGRDLRVSYGMGSEEGGEVELRELVPLVISCTDRSGPLRADAFSMAQKPVCTVGLAMPGAALA